MDKYSQQADFNIYKQNSVFINEIKQSEIIQEKLDTNSIINNSMNDNKLQQTRIFGDTNYYDNPMESISQQSNDTPSIYSDHSSTQRSFQTKNKSKNQNSIKDAVSQTLIFQEDVMLSVFGSKQQYQLQQKEKQQQNLCQSKNGSSKLSKNKKKSSQSSKQRNEQINNFINPQQNSKQKCSYSQKNNLDQQSDIELGLNIVGYYKKIFQQIEQNLQNKQNPLTCMMKIFYQVLNQRYTKKLNNYIDLNQEESVLDEIKNKITAEIKSFIDIFSNTLCLYYFLSEFSQTPLGGLITKDTIINFCTTLIFNESIYSLVMEIYKLQLDSKIKKIQDQILKYRKKPIQYFNIKEELQLNEKTAEFLMNESLKIQNQEILKQQKKQEQYNMQNIPQKRHSLQLQQNNEKLSQVGRQLTDLNQKDNKDLNYDDNLPTIKNNQSSTDYQDQVFQECQQNQNSSNSEQDSKNNNIHNTKKKQSNATEFGTVSQASKNIRKVKKVPYHKVYEEIKNLNYLKSPIHKLKVISKCVELIYQEIDDFYQEYDFTHKEYGCIECDDLLILIVYNLVKSQMPTAILHLEFIKDFISSNLSNSTNGRNLMLFYASTQILQDYQEDDIENNKQFTNNNYKETQINEQNEEQNVKNGNSNSESQNTDQLFNYIG
ncbi:hypothetical protein PPERSA_03415 [Pseudocohnilembus persalinus]|uniref:VPS9 domain-containing protein n=1 Tax=Pseudocohnilembus persalinus TaxID=266149 RepID=A0A0V0QBL7_PSEPJ|nr:hypothetical protein PPERSA_03415 [Pseudocohnilembus persalinus]|eukprot:KRW99614.1 hypothetical protein PPERSA_03415 [Pseudocohnilembus persalinus]